MLDIRRCRANCLKECPVDIPVFCCQISIGQHTLSLAPCVPVFGNVTDAQTAERIGDWVDLEVTNLTTYLAAVSQLTQSH